MIFWPFISAPANRGAAGSVSAGFGIWSLRRIGILERHFPDPRPSALSRFRNQFLWLCVWWLTITAGLQAADGTLTRIAELKALNNDQAATGRPVDFTAVITACKPYFFVIEDESGAVYVDPGEFSLRFEVGQRVRVQGQSARGLFAPTVGKPVVTLLGPGTLPRPLIIPWNHLLTGAADNRWVEVNGVIKQVANEAGEIRLEMDGIEGRFSAWCRVLPNERTPESLVDSEVRLTGVYQAKFNDAGQIGGFLLQIPSVRHIQIEKAAVADPFSRPVSKINSLLRYDTSELAGHRVHFQGEVLFHDAGQAVYLTDGTGTVRATSTQSGALRPGDRVSVVGFPVPAVPQPELEDANFRRINEGPAPVPIPVEIADLGRGTNHHQLVQLTAKVIGVAQGATRLVLTLRSGDTVFEVQQTGLPADFPIVQEGSRIRLTGICRVEMDRQRQPAGFSLQLRSRQDVEVLQLPPWWTLQRVLLVTTGFGGLALLGLSWAMWLRRRVQAQTRELEIQLTREIELERRFRTLAEGSPVGIWQSDLHGETVYMNPAMNRLLGRAPNLPDPPIAWRDFLRPGPQNPFRTRLDVASKDIEVDVRVKGLDGVARHLLISTAPPDRFPGQQPGRHSLLRRHEHEKAVDHGSGVRARCRPRGGPGQE